MPQSQTVTWLHISLRGQLLWLAKREKGLCLLELGEQSKEKFRSTIEKKFPAYQVVPGSSQDFLPYLLQLERYFAGVPVDLDLPVDLVGTPFQLLVWNALRRIPYGTTRTYGEIAHEIGRPKAFRAVGGACHRNPVLLFVPCHRVIGSDGSLVGFGAGLELKKALLELEQQGIGKLSPHKISNRNRTCS